MRLLASAWDRDADFRVRPDSDVVHAATSYRRSVRLARIREASHLSPRRWGEMRDQTLATECTHGYILSQMLQIMADAAATHET